MLSQLRQAVLVTLALAVVCCGLYPLIVFGIGQPLFPAKANGSLIVDAGGVVRGSRLIGQPFAADKYFHPRPSAAGNGYDPTSSGGSNLGPTSQKLRDGIVQNLADYRSQNGLATNAPVPADAVTASGSGLDPHISAENARIQADRYSGLVKSDAVSQQDTDTFVNQAASTAAHIRRDRSFKSGASERNFV